MVAEIVDGAQLTGTVSYPQLSCSGTWIQHGSTANGVRLITETITQGNCVNSDVTLTPHSDGTLSFMSTYYAASKTTGRHGVRDPRRVDVTPSSTPTGVAPHLTPTSAAPEPSTSASTAETRLGDGDDDCIQSQRPWMFITTTGQVWSMDAGGGRVRLQGGLGRSRLHNRPQAHADESLRPE